MTRGGGVNHEITVALWTRLHGGLWHECGRCQPRTGPQQPRHARGHLIVGSQELQIRTAGNTDTLAALQDYRFTLPAGQAVRLGDIATITDGGAEARSDSS